MFRRTLAFALSLFVAFTGICPAVPAAGIDPVASGAFSVPESLKIPENLGEVKTFHRASGEAPFVILIQDAHAILEAQTSIRGLIEFLQKEQGIRVVALEGGKGKLDFTILKSFPDAEVKEKVLGSYLEKAELTGAQMAGIFSASGTYAGIEDWDLYEENYLAFLRATEAAKNAAKVFKVLRQDWDRKRDRIYSPELKLFHEKREAFESESAQLAEFLGALDRWLDFRARPELKTKYPDLAKLVMSMEPVRENDRESLERSIRRFAAAFAGRHGARLSNRERRDFNAAHQAFLSGELAPAAFLKNLLEKNHVLGLHPRLNPMMQRLLQEAETLGTLKGTRLFDELKTASDEIEARLAVSPAERDLAARYKRLRVLERLASLELTREDLGAYQRPRRNIFLFWGIKEKRSNLLWIFTGSRSSATKLSTEI